MPKCQKELSILRAESKANNADICKWVLLIYFITQALQTVQLRVTISEVLDIALH